MLQGVFMIAWYMVQLADDLPRGPAAWRNDPHSGERWCDWRIALDLSGFSRK